MMCVPIITCMHYAFNSEGFLSLAFLGTNPTLPTVPGTNTHNIASNKKWLQ